MEQQMAQQAEALRIQREQALAALEEQRAKVRELNAKAAKLEAEAAAGGQGGMDPEVERSMRQLQEQAAQQIEAMAEKLAKAQGELANRTVQIKTDADTAVEVARIKVEGDARVAEISAQAAKQIDALLSRMDDMSRGFEEKLQRVQQAAEKKIEQAVAAVPAPAPAEPAAAPAPAPEPPAPQPISLDLTVNVDATKQGAASFEIVRDAAGQLKGIKPVTGEDAAKGDAP